MMPIIARCKFSKLETMTGKNEKLECLPGVQAAKYIAVSCPAL
jgi:hypothetical protein